MLTNKNKKKVWKRLVLFRKLLFKDNSIFVSPSVKILPPLDFSCVGSLPCELFLAPIF